MPLSTSRPLPQTALIPASMPPVITALARFLESSHGILVPLLTTSPPSSTARPRPQQILEQAMPRDSFTAALSTVLAALLINHVRRLLAPPLGQFIWWHALEAMRSARSSPHSLLEESAHLSWSHAGTWLVVNRAVDLARRRLGRRLSRDGAVGHGRTGSRSRGKVRVLLCAAYMAFCVAHAEKLYAETCWAAAHLYASGRVLRGGGAGRGFLADLVRARWACAAFQVVMLGVWLRWRFVPSMRKAVGGAARGELGAVVAHGVVWGGTAHLVRYSNRYFVLLELSDMLVTFGWMALGVVVVGWEFWGRGLRSQ